jgi:hypothetical protein
MSFLGEGRHSHEPVGWDISDKFQIFLKHIRRWSFLASWATSSSYLQAAFSETSQLQGFVDWVEHAVNGIVQPFFWRQHVIYVTYTCPFGYIQSLRLEQPLSSESLQLKVCYLHCRLHRVADQNTVIAQVPQGPGFDHPQNRMKELLNTFKLHIS